jgi:hypothetical protein
MAVFGLGLALLWLGAAGAETLPRFSAPGGFYAGPLSLALEAGEPGVAVRYTLDGAEPTGDSPLYRASLALDSTRVVRARVFAPDPGPVATHTYFIGPPYTLPVFSLATDPAHLWDEETGIYVLGKEGDPEYPHAGANFWQDWERPLHIEFFEPDARLGFSAQAGVQIFGDRGGRTKPQKSLALFARRQYGAGRFAYPFFPDHPHLGSFESLVLRNSGNDWNTGMMRDALLAALVEGTGLDVQAYRPAIVFLNGRYWGIHELREKMNEHYLATHHGVDPDSVDLLEGNAGVFAGDAAHYRAMLAFLEGRDLGDPAAYAHLQTLMDVENFIDYQVAQIYCANTDWPGGNIKFWRPRSPGGRWQWLLFDADFGFGRWDYNSYDHPTLAFAMAEDGPEWPNPPWSTFLLRKLLENEGFRQRLANRFADRLNTTFHPERVLAAVSRLQATLEPEMPAHLARWEGGPVQQWRDQVQRIAQFARLRPSHLRQHLVEQLSLEGTLQLSLEVAPPRAGTLQVNDRPLPGHPWSGTYFAGLPIHLRALPRPGYRFAGWEGAEPADSSSLVLSLRGDARVSARFAPGEGGVVINEINYHSAPGPDPEDWVELCNSSPTAVDLSGWAFTDGRPGNLFALPAGTTVEGCGYLILCRDRRAFAALFPQVEHLAGDLGFGLDSRGDHLRLLDAQGNLADSLTYEDAPPWPPQADGTGMVLALLGPGLDNAQAHNWIAAPPTPGRPNAPPGRSSLESCHPNPFNTAATIRFSLSQAGQVRIAIYNLLGQQVAQVLEGPVAAGTHEVVFAGSNLGSGVYFCQLQAAGFRAARKLAILR